MKTLMAALIVLSSSISAANNLKDIEAVITMAVDVPINGEAYKEAQELLEHMKEYNADSLNEAINLLNGAAYYEQAFWKDNGRD